MSAADAAGHTDAPLEALPTELAGNWRTTVVLKRDVFSTVERGFFRTSNGEVAAVLRRIDKVPWWSRSIARHFLKREARALAIAGRLRVAPSLLFVGPSTLVRSWIDGLPLHIARPEGNDRFFATAAAALESLRRERLAHNDLAKEQNWLVGPDGTAFLTDFQLAHTFRRRGRAFRVLAYEDLRHLLKHKQKYLGASLLPSERRILGRKSFVSRAWMATGKKVYVLVSRGVFRFTDREGGGPRLVNDAPKIVAALKTLPGVTEAVVVAYPDRRNGTGLYAFVEAPTLGLDEARAAITRILPDVRPPELIQRVDAFPRSDGLVRMEILQLIALNQIDSLDSLLQTDAERAATAKIVAERENLRDRFSF